MTERQKMKLVPITKALKILHRKHKDLFVTAANKYLAGVKKEKSIQRRLKELEAEAAALRLRG